VKLELPILPALHESGCVLWHLLHIGCSIRVRFTPATDKGSVALLTLGRVGKDVATPTPHRPGRADFPLPVLHARASLTVM
jgi:hypothetical protein